MMSWNIWYYFSSPQPQPHPTYPNIFMILIHTTILGHFKHSSPVQSRQAGSQPTKGLDVQEGNNKRSVNDNGKYRAGAGWDWPASALTLHNNGNKTDWVFLPPKLTEKRDRCTQQRSSAIIVNLAKSPVNLHNTITFCYIPALPDLTFLPGTDLSQCLLSSPLHPADRQQAAISSGRCGVKSVQLNCDLLKSQGQRLTDQALNFNYILPQTF